MNILSTLSLVIPLSILPLQASEVKDLSPFTRPFNYALRTTLKTSYYEYLPQAHPQPLEADTFRIDIFPDKNNEPIKSRTSMQAKLTVCKLFSAFSLLIQQPMPNTRIYPLLLRPTAEHLLSEFKLTYPNINKIVIIASNIGTTNPKINKDTYEFLQLLLEKGYSIYVENVFEPPLNP